MPLSSKVLLSRHPMLHTNSMEKAQELTAGMWQRHDVEIRGKALFDSKINGFRTSTGSLTFVDCKTPLNIRCEPVGDFYSFQMHLSGGVEHTINGKKTEANPGRAVFLCPGQSLAMKTNPGRVLILGFEREFFEPELSARNVDTKHPENWSTGFSLRGGPGKALMALCLWAAEQLDLADSPIQQEIVYRHLQKSMAELAIGSLGSEAVSGVPLGKVRMRDLEEWVRSRLSVPLSVGDLAAYAQVTPRAIQMAFRQHRGSTPGQFIRDLRLDEARRQLSTRPHQSISEIALGLGFLHLSRFSGAYCARFGELPSETRKKSGF